jgi:hypothetical protein
MTYCIVLDLVTRLWVINMGREWEKLSFQCNFHNDQVHPHIGFGNLARQTPLAILGIFVLNFMYKIAYM